MVGRHKNIYQTKFLGKASKQSQRLFDWSMTSCSFSGVTGWSSEGPTMADKLGLGNGVHELKIGQSFFNSTAPGGRTGLPYRL